MAGSARKRGLFELRNWLRQADDRRRVNIVASRVIKTAMALER